MRVLCVCCACVAFRYLRRQIRPPRLVLLLELRRARDIPYGNNTECSTGTGIVKTEFMHSDQPRLHTSEHCRHISPRRPPPQQAHIHTTHLPNHTHTPTTHARANAQASDDPSAVSVSGAVTLSATTTTTSTSNVKHIFPFSIFHTYLGETSGHERKENQNLLRSRMCEG